MYSQPFFLFSSFSSSSKATTVVENSVENIKARTVSTKKHAGVGGGRKRTTGNERKKAPWQRREWNDRRARKTRKPRESHERERDAIGATHSEGREEQREVLGETNSAWLFHSQCFVAEVGRFWWVKLVQLAVEDIEAVEAHLRLYDWRITYTRTVRQHRCAVTRCTRGVVVQLLLFRTATAGSHVSLLAVVVVDYYNPNGLRPAYASLTLVSSRLVLPLRPPPSSSVPCRARAPPDDAARAKTAVSSPAISSLSFSPVFLSMETTTSKRSFIPLRVEFLLVIHAS